MMDVESSWSVVHLRLKVNEKHFLHHTIETNTQGTVTLHYFRRKAVIRANFSDRVPPTLKSLVPPACFSLLKELHIHSTYCSCLSLQHLNIRDYGTLKSDQFKTQSANDVQQ